MGNFGTVKTGSPNMRPFSKHTPADGLGKGKLGLGKKEQMLVNIPS